jgi:hypothetical protein
MEYSQDIEQSFPDGAQCVKLRKADPTVVPTHSEHA